MGSTLKNSFNFLATTVGLAVCLLVAPTKAHRSLLADPGISLATIESADGLLPTTKPIGFTYEPILPEFYKLINNITYFALFGGKRSSSILIKTS